MEQIEYPNTVTLVEQYTTDTPQSHPCGFKTQKVQQIQISYHAIIGGEIGNFGKETKRCWKIIMFFTYVIKKQYKSKVKL